MSSFVRTDVRSTTVGRAAIVLAVLIWGCGSVFVKLSAFGGLAFAFYRLWLAFAVMMAAILVTRRRLTFEVLRASAPAGLLFAADVGLFFTALKLTSIADATIIGALQPALVMVVAGPWFGERVGRREIALTALAIAGVGLVALGSAGSRVFSVGGDVLAGLALFSWTGYWLVSKRVRSRINALEYMTGVMLVSAVVLTPVTLVSGQHLTAPHLSDWVWLALFVLFPAALGQLLVAWAHRYVEVWQSSLLGLGMPVVSTVAALVVLGESLTGLEVAGGLVVLVAIRSLIARSGARDAPEPPG